MEWTDITLYVIVGMFVLVLICWLINLILVLKKKESNFIISRIMYLIALAAVVISSIRAGFAYSEKTFLFANIVVLICIFVSYWRAEFHHRYGDPEDLEDEERSEDKNG